jgi:hypothetical protein
VLYPFVCRGGLGPPKTALTERRYSKNFENDTLPKIAARINSPDFLAMPLFGVRGQVRALERRDMSRRGKAATCRRTPN